MSLCEFSKDGLRLKNIQGRIFKLQKEARKETKKNFRRRAQENDPCHPHVLSN